MKPKRISLSYELAEIVSALGAVRVLAEELAHGQFETQHDYERAPRWIAAVTGVVLERLRLLTRAMTGNVDPKLLWSHVNAAPPGVEDEPEVEDVVIVEWSAQRRHHQAKAELRRTRRHRRPKRRRGR